ncbi:hypothetical protein ARMSODRAFT_1026352 [Armillaria solidipes]|uniref:Transmembrane protein n=1 Tax=Armillaria solidipes TaxID=1076256 RepID=A0A2H3B9U4_9AGAR|nr:hypothetical protein ARMSODRAFT_1026352 [Armillaria solidipes]
MEFHVSDAVAYIAETLIIWDYLISIDDEVALFWAFLKKIVDQNFVLSGESQYHDNSGIECIHYDDIRIATLGYFSESGICSSLDTTWIFTYVDHSSLQQGQGWKEACYMFIVPESVIYVSIQLVVMESIMVVRAWAIMGRQRRVLWTFLGLLTFSTIASLVLCFLRIVSADGTYNFYFLPTIFLEAILFTAVVYHAFTYLRNLRSLQSSCSGALQPRLRPIMRLMFKDSIMYFVIIIAVLMIVPFLTDTLPLSLSVASITATRMLLRLRKQDLSDSAGHTSVQGELLTFRAVSGGINSPSDGEEDRSS